LQFGIKHTCATIGQYGDKLEPFNLKKFNKNLIDPIKLIFDKTVYRFSWEEIAKNEIFRQRDKSNNNDIGYFHQRIFQYIADCDVPTSGWDVVFTKEDGIDVSDGNIVSRVFVEMKNKHNTMNSAASGKTYIRMQSQLLADDDCACFLVEVIAKQSQNVAWAVSVDSQQKKHKRIRRVSIDKYYSLVTGQEDAFYQMCMVLPDVIEKAVSSTAASVVPEDSVIGELNELAQAKDGSFALALYMLGFSSYDGFAPKIKSGGRSPSMKGTNTEICEKCKSEFTWTHTGDTQPGHKAKEDVDCPYCGHVAHSFMTSGFIHVHKK